MNAGDFTALAARAREALGSKLELSDGTRATAAQVEARKRGAARKSRRPRRGWLEQGSRRSVPRETPQDKPNPLRH
jgi:hypothetical protein